VGVDELSEIPQSISSAVHSSRQRIIRLVYTCKVGVFQGRKRLTSLYNLAKTIPRITTRLRLKIGNGGGARDGMLRNQERTQSLTVDVTKSDCYDGDRGLFRVMRVNFGKIARYFLLTVSVLGIALVVIDLYAVLRPQDPLGVANYDCIKGDLSSVPNGSGLVATAHVTSCSFGLAHGAETTYAYVHKAGEIDSKESLVFRFANAGNLYRPQMVWNDDSSLHISVSEVGEVTEKVTSKEGVKISYSIGKEDMSREESIRLRIHNAEISSAWLMLFVTICVLSARSIRRQKNRTT
jgi:hypothetical protein